VPGKILQRPKISHSELVQAEASFVKIMMNNNNNNFNSNIEEHKRENEISSSETIKKALTRTRTLRYNS